MAATFQPSEDMITMSSDEAMTAMQSGEVPARLRVEGDLLFYFHPHKQDNILPPRALPADELIATNIVIHNASLLTSLPRSIRCQEFYLWDYPGDVAAESVIEFFLEGDRRMWGIPGWMVKNCPHITRLPELRGDLNNAQLDNLPLLTGLPASMQAPLLTITNCPALGEIPEGVRARQLTVAQCASLQAVPETFADADALTVVNCSNLARLPGHITADQLRLTQLPKLTALPADLRSRYIALDGCANLTRWDDPTITELRQFSARGCVALESLPPNLRWVDELDISGCERLTSLPAGLRVKRWIDVADSGLRALPASAWGAQVRWRGVNTTGQIAFHPETLTARQALAEPNAELRRLMLERIGPERFVREAVPAVLDTDMDRGGMRRLMRVNIEGDEPYVALEVRDPSTGRSYLLRVPPDMDSCPRAAAWIAGFDNPDDYAPLIET